MKTSRAQLPTGEQPDPVFGDTPEYACEAPNPASRRRRGLLRRLMSLPLRLAWFLLWPVRRLVGGLVGLWVDCLHAIRFYANQLLATVHRWLIAPVLFCIREPLSFAFTVIRKLACCLRAILRLPRSLFHELREQLGDVARFFRFVWLQALESLGLARPDPSPIHAVPVRQHPGAHPVCDPNSRTSHSPAGHSSASEMSFRVHEPASTSSRNSSTAMPDCAAAEPLADTFHVQPKPLVRAADEEVVTVTPTPHDCTRAHYQCPGCRSEEVYAVRRNGAFATSTRQLSWFVQNLYCERCIHLFQRPGKLLLAPKPLIRPLDAELYD